MQCCPASAVTSALEQLALVAYRGGAPRGLGGVAPSNPGISVCSAFQPPIVWAGVVTSGGKPLGIGAGPAVVAWVPDNQVELNLYNM